MQGSSMHGTNSVRMDSSFVVLPKQKPPVSGGPPHPRGGISDSGQPGKAMDESFVVVYKSESASDGGGANSTSPEGGPNSPLQPHNSGFHSTITILRRAFEMATTQMQVDQPVCLECMRVLSDKLDKEVEDVNRDIESHDACLQRLEGEAQDVLSEADFLKEKLKANPTDFTEMAWEGMVGAVYAARNSKQQIVESEHLMKALLEQKNGLARRILSFKC